MAIPSGARVGAASFQKLGGVASESQRLDTLLKARPEVSKFLSQLDQFMFDPNQAQGLKKTDMGWSVWGHSGIPEAAQDKDVILVTAEGGVYGNSDINIPSKGGTAKTQGKIIFVGSPEQWKDRQHKDIDGGFTTKISFPVHGPAGEVIKLRYMRLDIDDKSKVRNAGWPNDIGGNAWGGYQGRQYAAVLDDKLAMHILAPQDDDQGYRTHNKKFFSKT